MMALLKALLYTVRDLHEQLLSLRVHVCLKRLRKPFQKRRILLQIVLKIYSEDPD